MIKKILLLGKILFALLITQGQCQIKTVQCRVVGSPLVEPIIELGSTQQLAFSFDDLSAEVNSYTYKIVHCDPDWKPSNMSSFNYLTGFFSNAIEDYEYSYNTQIEYTHFSLLIPNEEVGIKISGNYLLQVFNDDDLDRVVVEQRFSVLEKKVFIAAQVVNSTTPKYLYSSQQLNFSVKYDNLPIYNPVKDVRVHVTQNQDPNTRRVFDPTFVRQNELIYGDGTNNIFNGLSPFRNFDCFSLVYYSQYVKDVLKSPKGQYNFILQPGTVPSRYVPFLNLDGNYYIKADNVQNQKLEADYVMTHFAILYPQPIQNADVYIYGKFSNWQLSPLLKMEYDYKYKAYVGKVELKQGRYDYMYAVVPRGSTEVDLVRMQNNFYQTLNEYSIRFYMYDYKLMCFRFVGYTTTVARL